MKDLTTVNTVLNTAILLCLSAPTWSAVSTELPGTGQIECYDTHNSVVTCPLDGQLLSGQDAQYITNPPSYTDNGDGTITDNITGLMWQQDPDRNGDGQINANDYLTYPEALGAASTLTLGGYTDWRLPTIKELYSLIDFSGDTGTMSPDPSLVPTDAIPFIDTGYFIFEYGDMVNGERYIDAQYLSSTTYVGLTMGGNGPAEGATVFGVNFADGRIKGYSQNMARFARYVRGYSEYGVNDYIDNEDATITDEATGRMWLQADSGSYDTGYTNSYADAGSLSWTQALSWCEGLDEAGYTDWRLPNAKELQSIVDYSRSLSTTGSPAIDPLFDTTLLPNGINSSGETNYPYYWASTTHLDGPASSAVYVAFGEARGYMDLGDGTQLYDVHGAGAQRSDPKSGDPTPYVGVGFGPQGDVISIYNYARCVRNIDDAEEVINLCSGQIDPVLANITLSRGEMADCTVTGTITLVDSVVCETGAKLTLTGGSLVAEAGGLTADLGCELQIKTK